MIRDDLEKEVEKEVELDGDTSISELLKEQGIEEQEVLVSRNGTIISGQHTLEDGDEIKIFDVIAGG